MERTAYNIHTLCLPLLTDLAESCSLICSPKSRPCAVFTIFGSVQNEIKFLKNIPSSVPNERDTNAIPLFQEEAKSQIHSALTLQKAKLIQLLFVLLFSTSLASLCPLISSLVSGLVDSGHLVEAVLFGLQSQVSNAVGHIHSLGGSGVGTSGWVGCHGAENKIGNSQYKFLC